LRGKNLVKLLVGNFLVNFCPSLVCNAATDQLGQCFGKYIGPTLRAAAQCALKDRERLVAWTQVAVRITPRGAAGSTLSGDSQHSATATE